MSSRLINVRLDSEHLSKVRQLRERGVKLSDVVRGTLVALCDARDQKHRVAVKHLESLRSNEFAVSDAVLTEACFHLPHRHQRQRLYGLLEALGVQPIPHTSSTVFWLEVFDWLNKYAEHEPDRADGCLAVLCGRDKNTKVWTYDRDFLTTWRRPNGTVIPLAVKSS